MKQPGQFAGRADFGGSPASDGGRGLKLKDFNGESGIDVGSPASDGGRGLKQKVDGLRAQPLRALIETVCRRNLLVFALSLRQRTDATCRQQDAAENCRERHGRRLAVKNGVALPHDMEGAQAENELAVAGNDAGELVCWVERSPH